MKILFFFNKSFNASHAVLWKVEKNNLKKLISLKTLACFVCLLQSEFIVICWMEISRRKVMLKKWSLPLTFVLKKCKTLSKNSFTTGEK